MIETLALLGGKVLLVAVAIGAGYVIAQIVVYLADQAGLCYRQSREKEEGIPPIPSPPSPVSGHADELWSPFRPKQEWKTYSQSRSGLRERIAKAQLAQEGATA